MIRAKKEDQFYQDHVLVYRVVPGDDVGLHHIHHRVLQLQLPLAPGHDPGVTIHLLELKQELNLIHCKALKDLILGFSYFSHKSFSFNISFQLSSYGKEAVGDFILCEL